MQSVPITTDVVSSNLDQGKVNNRVPVNWETKRRNRICKLRNEAKRNEIIQWILIKKKIHSSTSASVSAICSSISKTLYFVIEDVFYTYAICFIWQKSCTFPNKYKHFPIPYKCIVNQFNFIMIDGHIKILIWHCKLTKYSI